MRRKSSKIFYYYKQNNNTKVKFLYPQNEIYHNLTHTHQLLHIYQYTIKLIHPFFKSILANFSLVLNSKDEPSK